MSLLPDASLPLQANVLIVEGRFYEKINDALLLGIQNILQPKRIRFEKHIVSGALEIPTAIAILTEKNKPSTGGQKSVVYHGVIAVGCVIRGETSHYELIARESTHALLNLSISLCLPIGNAILTVENEEQAIKRSDPFGINRGGEAALACLELIRLKNHRDSPHVS